uniref:Uncharacterized protein n=1 Tax=Tanacetum cinerariifolium TaxID=118510 RepID=A0A6L2L800_TANCI|nr:hypothetical protein [Tanacetum cinerariifolium]
MILESVEHGPLIWPTVEENGVSRTNKYAKLSAAKKIQADCDMKATDIILQGLPADIYSLVNHHRNGLKAQLKDKDTTICKLKDTIKSLRKNNKEEIVDHDRCDLATINAELCDSLIYKLNLKSAKHGDLKAQIQDKDFVITSLKNGLRKLKGKATVDNATQIPSAITVVPGMFKLDLEPLAPKLMHNRESHIFYLKHTQDQADILRGIVEQAKAKQPLDNELDFACKHAKRIQELLVYVQNTCPSAVRTSETKVARTPMNKIKKVTFFEPIATSSTNQETHDSNKPMLHSTGVKFSTSASGSKPSGNTKNNRISQPSSSSKINKVEDQPRSVKTRKNNHNRVKKVKCEDHVMQSSSNANSVSISINNAPLRILTEFASRRAWFIKPSRPQEPTDPDWNKNKTPQKGPTQNWLMTLVASTSTDKSLKEFDELMSTPIDFSSYILNGLKIENLTQEIMLGPAFRLLKGTRLNYAELEYDFEECYKALSENLDWENPEGGDYPFDLSKPLPLITRGNRQRVPVEGVSTMTYTTSTTKTKAAQYDLPVMRKHGYGYLEEIVVRKADNMLYKFKEGDDVTDFAIALRMFIRSLVIQKRVEDLQLGVESYQKQINVTKPNTKRPDLRKRHPLLSSLEDIAKNIDIDYLPKRRWSTLEKKRAYCMIKDINKLLKERMMMRSLEKFVGGRLYETNLKLLQRTIQNWRDLPRDIPLYSLVVLSYEKRSKSENKGKVPTEMELVLEQTQQGSSYEVSKSQDHKMGRLQDDAKRLCLVDDLKKLKDHIHVKPKELALSKVKDHYIKSQVDE